MRDLGESKEKGQNIPKSIAYSQFSRRFGYQDTTWDIEDLVRGGNREGLCPYFVSKAILGGVEIVFCPYNYLIDKKIRASMEINLGRFPSSISCPLCGTCRTVPHADSDLAF